MIKGESEAQEEASLRRSRMGGRTKEWSAIKGIQAKGMDDGKIKLMQQDFKELY